MKPAIQRALAQQDIVKAFEHYRSVAESSVAARFVGAIDDCMQHIERFPQVGSLRYAQLLEVEGLRFVVVEHFPYLIFYFEQPDYLDVVRVLHQHQDIPAILSG